MTGQSQLYGMTLPLFTEKLKDIETVERSTRVKAERKHKIWGGALLPLMDLRKQ